MHIHYMYHNFADWARETSHMSILELGIYTKIRDLYFSNSTASNGSLPTDKGSLCFLLGCKSDAEVNALDVLLKHHFKKLGNKYRNSNWDKQIKAIVWEIKKPNNGNTGNDCGNDVGNGGNVNGNTMSNAERTAKSKAERKNIITALKSIGADFDSKAPIATLRALYSDNFGNAEIANVVMEIAESGNNNGNTGNDCGNDVGNGGNAENPSNINNLKTINHNLINISFDDFWDAYDKKRGDIEKIKKKWADLKDLEREAIMNHIPLYKQSQPDKKFRKDPATYLNNKSWNDEIIYSGSQANTDAQNNQSRFGTKDDPLAVNLAWDQDITPVSTMTYEEMMAQMQSQPIQPINGYEEL